jgi:hypothetical protein
MQSYVELVGLTCAYWPHWGPQQNGPAPDCGGQSWLPTAWPPQPASAAHETGSTLDPELLPEPLPIPELLPPDPLVPEEPPGPELEALLPEDALDPLAAPLPLPLVPLLVDDVLPEAPLDELVASSPASVPPSSRCRSPKPQTWAQASVVTATDQANAKATPRPARSVECLAEVIGCTRRSSSTWRTQSTLRQATRTVMSTTVHSHRPATRSRSSDPERSG